ncbi:hypothetical protein CB1_001027008 [Camelus ferus]|nr:hypothetical protein CB1_001027008 [Camelus ferus]
MPIGQSAMCLYVLSWRSVCLTIKDQGLDDVLGKEAAPPTEHGQDLVLRPARTREKRVRRARRGLSRELHFPPGRSLTIKPSRPTLLGADPAKNTVFQIKN